jgi:hypothetical protein
MPLIQVVSILVVSGVILWLINRLRPLDKKTRSILNLVVIVAMILWLMWIFGFLGDIANIHIGR